MSRLRLDLPQAFLFSTEIPIRISDINYGGHLGNDAVLSLVHEARVRFFGSLGYTELNVEGAAIMMTDATVVYRAEGFHGEVLRIDVAVGDLESATCDLLYRVTNVATGKEVARVKTGIVFVDPLKKKISSIPEPFRAKVTH